jgi:hypothetical protein
MDTMGNLLKRRRPAPETPEPTEPAPTQTPASEAPATEPTATEPTATEPVTEVSEEANEVRGPRPVASEAEAEKPGDRAGKSAEPTPKKKARAGAGEGRAERQTPRRRQAAGRRPVAPTVVAESVSREPEDLRAPPQTQRVSVTLDPSLRERARIALNAAHNTGDYRLGDFADVLREAAVLLVSGSFAERQLGRLPKGSAAEKVTTTLRVNDALFQHLQRISKKKRSELLQRALVSYLERGLS